MNIVFYDGECGLCQRSIRLLIKLDSHHKLFFAPLNGETYQKFFGSTPSPMNTVVFRSHSGMRFEKSEAFLELGNVLFPDQFCFKFIKTLVKLLPVRLRDALYDQIAKRRNRLKCVLLQKDNRFLS